VGSINMDIIVEVERLPRVGETLSGSNAVLAHGGKGANQAVAISRLGGQSSLVGKVGSDAFGTEIRQGLESTGVDTSFVGSVPGTATGVAMILLVKGDNTIVVSPGANQEVGRDDIVGASAVIQESQALLTQLEIPMDSVAFAMETARRLGVTTILDPGPARRCPPEMLALADYITPNQTEASALTGVDVSDLDTARQAAHRLLEYAGKGVVVTLGAAGSLVVDREIEEYVEAIAVDVVDTTAAGDAFCGALAVALAGDMPLVEAACFANVVGAITVTRLGAQLSIPTRLEVERFVAERGLSIPWPPS
jgi:ribokinase